VVFQLNNYTEALVPKVYHSFKMIDGRSGTFFEYLFATKIPDRELGKLVSSGARMDGLLNITYDDFMSIKLTFPKNNEEQTAIGSFFQDIDQLISLQQRKLEVLKEQKKTYLKLLFPAKGQTKPALRFAGFEDEWKEVKLGEIIKSISSKNYITEYSKEGNNPVIQQGDIPIVGFSDNKPFNNFSNVILFGDHTLSLFKPETPFLLATDGIKILHSDLTTQSFLFIMLERYLPKSQGYKRHYSLLKNELSSLPSLPEQEAIGSFFQDLDKAIAKQEEKVNQLKESKQTLLRKMFI
jgi:restriction modification system DNA specificity domain protein